jgi:hypothetical protein
MSHPIDIRDVRKRTIQLMNYEDGLWDLLLGMIFMLLAFYPVTRQRLGPELNIVLFLVALGGLVAVHFAARYFFSRPRVGSVRSAPTPALKSLLVITILLVAATFILVLLTMFGSFSITLPSWMGGLGVELIAMIVMVGLFSLMGYLFGVVRLYFYGWLLGGGNLASVIVGREFDVTLNIPMAIVATIIIAIGLALLVRFVQRYPVPVQES